MNTQFLDSLPESVTHYLSDSAIESSVDHLTEIKKDGLPAGLENWREYGDFLAARAAAHLTRAEYPIALWLFWRHVWESEIPEQWKVHSPDYLGDDMVGPLTCWEDENLVLQSDCGELELYTLVGINSSSTTVGFAVENDAGSLISGPKGRFEWRKDQEFDGYLIKIWDVSITAPEFPWSEVYAVRDEALKIVEGFCSK
ncbi:hypothetical protein GRI69_11765 [Erythrobacter vulgaris]|uniref:Uncharacterized protein n=1 Tax=Qipengyuania vulgaris TaxID=291985 RepID=A0A844XTZ8_9SPHN|nr:hypothetical protein [Qipengyuania vulgaris]MXO48934.1 hypothetical protein [Qipengyuania vulgaris]